jgi:hypothetical protein
MSGEQSLNPRLEAWVAVVAYDWQRRGVSGRDRARLRVDLERDLRLAVVEGASVDALTDADPSEFARELATADGLITGPLRPDHPLTTRSLVLTALLGAAGGAVATVVLFYPLGLWFLDQLTVSSTAQGVFAVGLHVVAASICTVFAVAAVRWRFRFHSGIRRTAIVTGLLLLLGGAASVAPTMALAASLGYSGRTPVVLLELGVVLAFCIAGLGTSRWILTRMSGHSSASV